MAAEPAGLERLPAEMREPIRRYADLVREIAGDHARSLTLYGAIAAGTFEPDIHTAQNVLVLDAVDLRGLRTLAEHGSTLGKSNIAAPLIMTPEYIRDSLDTFPLELLEISQQHLVVFGDDLFANLSFDESHMRLQCERELKSILIGMRQALLAAAGREEFVDAIEANVAATLMRTLRGMLWLKGTRDAQPAAAVVEQAEKLVNRQLAGVRLAIKTRTTHDWDHFESLYHDVEKLGETVDAW